jgi:hypothetical protein
MLEIPPGTENAEKAADALAAKLREVVGEEAYIHRPMKCAEIRVTGLDDSSTAEEVVEAIAREGDCTTANIKPGIVSRGMSGIGSLWVSCPVAVAKKVVETGRLRVGWVSARVVLLDAKPLRCYRCQEAGHVGAKCDRGVDRSNWCHRCGKPDHKARECTNEAHCVICAAAGKPAAHRKGGKGCQSMNAHNNKPRGGRKTKDNPDAPAPASSQLTATEEKMDTAQ